MKKMKKLWIILVWLTFFFNPHFSYSNGTNFGNTFLRRDNRKFFSGDYMISNNGVYTLSITKNGFILLRKNGVVRWHYPERNSHSNSYLKFTNPDGRENNDNGIYFRWDNSSGGLGGNLRLALTPMRVSHLLLQEDGKLMLVYITPGTQTEGRVLIADAEASVPANTDPKKNYTEFIGSTIYFPTGATIYNSGYVLLKNSSIRQSKNTVTITSGYVDIIPGKKFSDLTVESLNGKPPGMISIKSTGAILSISSGRSASSSDIPSAIEENIKAVETPTTEGVSVFPNPTTGLVDFVTKNSEETILSIEIFNANASRVLSRYFTQTINLTELPPGMYLYYVHTSTGKVHSGKIIKTN